jgi:hypothetical protein
MEQEASGCGAKEQISKHEQLVKASVKHGML